MDVLPSQRATGMGVHSRVFKYHQVSYCSGVSSDPPFQERKQSIWCVEEQVLRIRRRRVQPHGGTDLIPSVSDRRV